MPKFSMKSIQSVSLGQYLPEHRAYCINCKV